MHFEPEDFVSFTITILENGGIQVTVNATVVFWMVSIDIKGFDNNSYIYVYNILKLLDKFITVIHSR